MRELEQKRAAFALAAVKALEGADPKTRKSYTAYAKSLPANIVMAGLGQAVAMAMSKAGGSEGASAGGDKAAWTALLRHLEQWLLREAGGASPYSGAPDENRPGLALMNAVTEGDQRAYLAAQAEALAILGWLKKFANALLVERAEAAKSGETAS